LSRQSSFLEEFMRLLSVKTIFACCFLFFASRGLNAQGLIEADPSGVTFSGNTQKVICFLVDSANDVLYIGGGFNGTIKNSIFSPAIKSIASYNGTTLSAVGTDLKTLGGVTAMAFYKGSLYATGEFSRFDGTSWQTLLCGNGGVFLVYNNLLLMGYGATSNSSVCQANGFPLYSPGLAKWDGTQWLGVGPNTGIGNMYAGITGSNGYNTVAALAVYNNALYVAGGIDLAGSDISHSNPGVVVHNILTTDAALSFADVGGGTNGFIYAMTVYKNELYVGGRFTTAGGVSAHNIAKWNGTTWSALGEGTAKNVSYGDSAVFCLATYHDTLYAGGYFDKAGGLNTPRIAKWDGAAWHAVTDSTYGFMGQWIKCMAVYKDKLFVGGDFGTYRNGHVIGPWAVVAGSSNAIVSQVTAKGPLAAIRLRLGRNAITFNVPQSTLHTQPVTITLFDAQGRRVMALDVMHTSVDEWAVHPKESDKSLPVGLCAFRILNKSRVLATGMAMLER
jgi:hypothetical protein